MALYIADAAAMERLGAAIGARLAPGSRVSLYGALGAGKTTLVRGLLRARGHPGPVRSPTYTLVESYVLAGAPVHHFDLYRLGAARELELIGARDYFDGESLCLVEWPEHGEALLGRADLELRIAIDGHARRVSWQARPAALARALAALAAEFPDPADP